MSGWVYKSAKFDKGHCAKFLKGINYFTCDKYKTIKNSGEVCLNNDHFRHAFYDIYAEDYSDEIISMSMKLPKCDKLLPFKKDAKIWKFPLFTSENPYYYLFTSDSPKVYIKKKGEKDINIFLTNITIREVDIDKVKMYAEKIISIKYTDIMTDDDWVKL